MDKTKKLELEEMLDLARQAEEWVDVSYEVSPQSTAYLGFTGNAEITIECGDYACGGVLFSGAMIRVKDRRTDTLIRDYTADDNQKPKDFKKIISLYWHARGKAQETNARVVAQIRERIKQ